MANIVIGLAGSSHAYAALSSISNVTLYPGSATVERQIKVPAKSTRIDISCLPASFDLETLRLTASPGMQLGDFRADDTEQSDAQCASTARDQRVKALQTQLASLNARAQAVELSAAYLKKVSEDNTETGAKIGLPEVSRSLQASGYQVFTQRDGIKRQQDEVQKRLDALQKDGSGSSATRTIHVALDAPSGGVLTIAYDTQRAGWIPAYQATLDSSNGELTLERRALVAQATGEDWRGVKLRLSTGTPTRNTRAPEPAVWRLAISQPRTASASAPMPTLAAPPPAPPMPMPAEMRASQDANTPLFAPVQIDGAFMTQFEIPGRADVPSDAQKVGFTLGSQRMPVKLSARVVPRQSTQAWLIATADRPNGLWPEGDVQLRRDGEQVGTTRWSDALGDDELALSFGRDEQVFVSKADGADSTGALKARDGRTSKTFSMRYTVKNLHRTPIAVEIVEATPISDASDLAVSTTLKPEPEDASWQGHQGIVAWRRSLAAGQQATVNASYTVTYPSDRTVYGLP
ncbi:DUF4139 domain-containing protein [Caballeronia sp. M1242]|uniref:DUF4139 domain-containing protein n=1 Tax=Caballeronia sp. M1242 TaxID=2814653 RepID=UPI0019D2E765|nr:DUF4139 domain-containing protein [Caballeronia sp. M1242]QSN61590.1 DUF4139 domain-containing protein [Caballeronia sp. M1242]